MSNASSNLRRLKYAATINDEALPEETDPEFELQYVDIGNVDSSGRIDQIAAHRFEAAPSRARRIVRHGDIIISTVRTYLQAIAAIENPPNNLIVSTGFAVVRPRKGELDANFCKYAVRELRFLREVVTRSVGVSYPAINSSDLGDISIALPPLAEQRAIAVYLDRETARLDQLVTAKERWLELLAEKRRALITIAVTRGIHPAAPLRDSGVAWLGELPAHWEVKKAKWLFREIDERTSSGEEELLSLRMNIGLIRHNDVSEKQTRAEELIGFKLTERDDIVVNKMRASSGLVSITPERGLVSPDYTVIRKLVELNCEYFVKLFGTSLMQAVFRSESKGLGTGASGFLRIYSENLLSIKLPVPPLNEQHAIVAHITAQTAKIDALRAATERTIGLLKERRAALIAAAVTGKIAVPSAAVSGRSGEAHEN